MYRERHIIGLFNFSTKQIELQAIYENVKQMDKPNMNRIFMQGLMEYGDSIEYQDWSSNVNLLTIIYIYIYIH